MSSDNNTLIRLEGVTKVFLTDEMETHALAGVHLEIKKGEYFSISGPSGPMIISLVKPCEPRSPARTSGP